MHRLWVTILVITASGATFTRSPNPDLCRAEELYRRTEYARAIDALQGLEGKDAAGYALLGKAYFMEGQYKEAVSNLEKAIGEDSLNSDYYDWLGRPHTPERQS